MRCNRTLNHAGIGERRLGATCHYPASPEGDRVRRLDWKPDITKLAKGLETLKSGGWALNFLIVQAGAGLNPF
jgi:hypothetical protein